VQGKNKNGSAKTPRDASRNVCNFIDSACYVQIYLPSPRVLLSSAKEFGSAAGTTGFGSRGGFFACVGDDDNNASALPAPSVSFIICRSSSSTSARFDVTLPARALPSLR